MMMMMMMIMILIIILFIIFIIISAEYIAESYQSSTSLLPLTPEQRAIMKLFSDTFERTLGGMMMKILKGSMDDDMDWSPLVIEMKTGMTALEKMLSVDSSGPYLFGNQFTLGK